MPTPPEPEIAIERFDIFASVLDHPECVAFDREGYLWAGGEAGQVYRIDREGKVETVVTLGGFTGGIAFSPLDHALYVCNPSLGLVRVDAAGRLTTSCAVTVTILRPPGNPTAARARPSGPRTIVGALL